MIMKIININSNGSPYKVTAPVRDLRSTDHPEFEDIEDIEYHIQEAIRLNGLRDFGRSIFEDIYEKEKTLKPLGVFQHLYHLAGGAKGVIRYRMRYRKSSFRRYQFHHYESLEVLRKEILLKHKGRIYWGKNGYQRIELIRNVNKLCAEIEHPKVLEAGCGSGLNIYLLNRLNQNIEIHGFEYTNARFASCIVNLFHSRLLDNIFLADICDMNLPDASYDVVYSNHVLEQLGQKKAEVALKEMWRVCRKGLVLSEPSVRGANVYEKWRMNVLGYCKDLYPVAECLPDSRILEYKEDDYRTYPNTSHHLVIEKVKWES